MSWAQSFARDGYCVAPLGQSAMIESIQQLCLTFLREFFRDGAVTLEQYHGWVESDDQHRAIQFQLFERLHASGLHQKLVEENLSFFKQVFGPDIDIQARPYIRIARPSCAQDNIGFHWDTFYGNSAYEVSCLFPLTANSPQGSLQIAPGSHLWPTSDYEQQVAEAVGKGSMANQMGFLYAPKTIKGLDYSKLIPVPVKPEEMLMFSLGVLHGQEVNGDANCRWSIDFRLKSSFTPVSKHLKEGYYRRLCTSPLTEVAQDYYRSKPDEAGALVGAIPTSFRS